MNTVDIILGIILLLAFFGGFKKGFIASLASLIGLVVGAYAAIYLSDFVGGYISRWFDFSEYTTKWIAFIATFLGVLILANMLGEILTKIIDFAALGLLNKLLGGIFGALKYAFILSLIFWFFGSSNLSGYIISEEKKEGSILYPYIVGIAPSVLPSIMEEFKKLEVEAPSEEPPLEEEPVIEDPQS